MRHIAVFLCCWIYLAGAGHCPGQSGRSNFEVAGVRSDGWPQLRGPGYDGISTETGLEAVWPTGGPSVLWLRDLGQGYSSFAAAGTRVYTQTQGVLGQYVVCLNGETGETEWEYRYDLPYEPAGLYPGPRSTPTYRGGRIYYCTPDAVVGCLNATNGRPEWAVDLHERFRPRGADFGFAASPVIENGMLFLPVGGRGASIVALSAKDGTTLWATGDEPASYCSLLPITFRGRPLLVAFLQNALAILDQKTGEWVWHASYSQGYDEHSASPLYEEPFLFVASPFRSGSKVYRLNAPVTDAPDAGTAQSGGSLSVSLVWERPIMSNDVMSSVLLDGHVYGFDLRDVQSKVHRPSRGTFRCLRLADGEECWSSDEPGHSSIIAADGKLVLFNDKGQLFLIRASPVAYQELARTEIFGEEICWTSPALHQKRLYLRTHTRAACLYLGELEQLTAAARKFSIPASEVPRTSGNAWLPLLGKEREFLFDPPSLEQLWRWYLVCLWGVFLPAAAGAGLAAALARGMGAESASRPAETAFWSLAALCGFVATPLGNRFLDEYVFTWPVVLFVTLQGVIAVSARLNSTSSRSQRMRARMAGLLLLAVSFGYFSACRRLSLHHEWAFLMGLLPASPACVLVARARQRSHSLLVGLVGAIAAFSVFYWSAGGWMIGKRVFGV